MSVTPEKSNDDGQQDRDAMDRDAMCRTATCQTTVFRAAIAWIGFNLVLLGLYLGFFYMCLAVEYPRSLVIGVAIAVVMGCLCFRYYRLFINRYEFCFYLVLPLDVVMESLVAEHTGYSFYWCALAFWTIFVIYRIVYLLRYGADASSNAQVGEL